MVALRAWASDHEGTPVSRLIIALAASDHATPTESTAVLATLSPPNKPRVGYETTGETIMDCAAAVL